MMMMTMMIMMMMTMIMIMMTMMMMMMITPITALVGDKIKVSQSGGRNKSTDGEMIVPGERQPASDDPDKPQLCK